MNLQEWMDWIRLVIKHASDDAVRELYRLGRDAGTERGRIASAIAAARLGITDRERWEELLECQACGTRYPGVIVSLSAEKLELKMAKMAEYGGFSENSRPHACCGGTLGVGRMIGFRSLGAES